MSERLTDEQLREIEARYKASTEGVWYWGEGNSTVLCWEGIVTATENIFVNCGRSSGEPSDEDRDFLVSAHQDVPALLAEIQALKQAEQRITELEDAITQAGIILSGSDDEDDPGESPRAVKLAMKTLGSVMNDPRILKRQGI